MLKYYLRQPLLGYEKDLNNFETDLFMNLTTSIKNRLNPYSIISTYFGNNSSYDLLDKEWKKNIKHNIYTGNSINSIFISQLRMFKMDKFIQEQFGFVIRYNKAFMNYTYNKFITLCKVEIAMYIAKYGYENFFYFEFRTMIIRTLFNYLNCAYLTQVNLLDEYYSWAFNVEDIFRAIDELENTELKKYLELAKQYKMTSDVHIIKEIQNPTKLKIKRIPRSREELVALNMTMEMKASEKYQILYDNYDIHSPSTARYYLNLYGFTDQRKNKYKNKTINKKDNNNSINDFTNGNPFTVEELNSIASAIIRDLELKHNITRENLPKSLTDFKTRCLEIINNNQD